MNQPSETWATRRRCHRSQRFCHRPVEPRRACRTGKPAGPHRGGRNRRTQIAFSRHAGRVDHRLVRRRRRSDRGRRENADEARRCRPRKSLSLPELPRWLLSRRHAYRSQARLPQVQWARARRAGAWQGRPGGGQAITRRNGLQLDATIYDLEEVELCYAPQFGSARDPVNFAGMVAANVLRGDMPLAHWTDTDGALLFDVRDRLELAVESVQDAINIPVQASPRLGELPRDRQTLPFKRAY